MWEEGGGITAVDMVTKTFNHEDTQTVEQVVERETENLKDEDCTKLDWIKP